MAGDDQPPPLGAAPSARVFRCPQCGASLSIRAVGQTKTVGCRYCGTIIDVDDDQNFKVAQAAKKKIPEPLIPLGAMGKFKGDNFEVIGYLIRSDGTETWFWREYLLYNPYKGFRWLVEYNGHWAFYLTTKNKPQNTGSSSPSYLGTRFKLFQEGTAKVQLVLGEFYWVVRTGDMTKTADFVSPPYILTREGDAHETVWSLGEYVPPDYVKAAFKDSRQFPIKEAFPTPTGIHPGEPSPVKPWLGDLWQYFLFFFIALFVIQFFYAFRAQDKLVYEGRFEYKEKNVKSDVTTQVSTEFPVTGHGNVEMDVYADLNNTWLAFDLALIEKSTGKRYEGDVEIGYYSGYDSDGSWSEGTRRGTFSAPDVPAGNYYITVDMKGEPAFYGKDATVAVYRDRAPWGPFWLGLFFLLAIPGILQLFQGWYEYRRWQDSDYPWVTQGSD